MQGTAKPELSKPWAELLRSRAPVKVPSNIAKLLCQMGAFMWRSPRCDWLPAKTPLSVRLDEGLRRFILSSLVLPVAPVSSAGPLLPWLSGRLAGCLPWGR